MHAYSWYFCTFGRLKLTIFKCDTKLLFLANVHKAFVKCPYTLLIFQYSITGCFTAFNLKMSFCMICDYCVFQPTEIE